MKQTNDTRATGQLLPDKKLRGSKEEICGFIVEVTPSFYPSLRICYDFCDMVMSQTCSFFLPKVRKVVPNGLKKL